MELRDYLKTSCSQTELARRLGVTQSLVWQWLSGRCRIDAEWAIKISKETGGAISVEELAPSIDWAWVRSRRSRKSAK